ncbi:MAG: CvpA family protein [Dehalococcoidales bacterium]|nr:CvpA family protein [Dehalococcoidales bacterium]
MNWLDIVIIVVLAVSAFLGLKIGLIKVVLALAGLIVGVILAGNFYIPLSEQLTFISKDGVAEVVAFAIILIVVMIIAAVLTRFLKWAASVMMLGWIDHLGGVAFGLILGAILCGALLATWAKWLGTGDTITESIVSAVLLDKFPLILALLPDEFDTIRSFFQ